jgi:hypothetical protein
MPFEAARHIKHSKEAQRWKMQLDDIHQSLIPT